MGIHMCGIAGFCNGEFDWKENIERMNDRLYHRGPDAVGVWASEDKQVVLGHRRLSIVDLTFSGSQPMESHDGRYIMAYNGEIYNYQEIKEKLIQEGKVTAFRGTSDTEALLEAVSAYGLQETLKKSKGMFAIALYDKEQQELFLARDRVGEKPLYYGFVGEQTFAFASELGALTCLDNFKNPINTGILQTYFRYGYIPAPYSIYQNIYKLEPGKVLKIKSPFNKYDLETYWSMREKAYYGQTHLFQGSEKEAAEELERLLKNAIRGQMAADVPVGAFLSAGIDSPTIVALMQSLSDRCVRSYTIGMWEKDFNEAEIAKKIAAHLGTEHTELYITEEDAKQVIPKLGGMFGEPFADSSQIPTYLVSKMTREHVTVSLSGDGGDELFGGYATYRSVERIWRQTQKIPSVIRKPASAAILHSPWGRSGSLAVRARLLGASGIEDMYRRSAQGEGIELVSADVLRKLTASGADGGQCITAMDDYPDGFLPEPVHNLMLMDMLMYHPDDILAKVDRTAMAVSLETRVPMLDRDVVEFAWSLPLSYKKQGDVTKKVLRDILYQYVPRELMERPKKGFAIPLQKWLKQPGLREWAESLLDRKRIKEQQLLNPDNVEKIWKDYIEHDIWRQQIWHVLMFQAAMF
ncbi:MAG: asparagine synthase (glutamine-hydrolyzing) [Bacillus sp. (in: Bacteria)]|nr:asparagine synthase (glutamine-hydrolyzing) [Bacillus sp. (in: firmicutes)]MCM1425470.1 asparagine synthase (glutamine-hydrolyzing) [Eubacterium sp.]